MIFSLGAVLLGLSSGTWLVACNDGGCIRNSDCVDGFICLSGGCIVKPDAGAAKVDAAPIVDAPITKYDTAKSDAYLDARVDAQLDARIDAKVDAKIDATKPDMLRKE